MKGPMLGVRTKHGGQGLGGIEEGSGLNGIVVILVDGDIDKGLLEGVEKGASSGNDGSRHVESDCATVL